MASTPRPGGDGAGACAAGRRDASSRRRSSRAALGTRSRFSRPLMAKEVFDGERRRGWAVEGSPADCVKLAIGRFCPQRPDLIVSGINGGLQHRASTCSTRAPWPGRPRGPCSASRASPCRWNTMSSRSSTGRPSWRSNLIEQILEAAGPAIRAAVQYQYPDRGARAADGSPRRADGDGRLAGRVRSSGSIRRAGATTGRWARRRSRRKGELTDLEAIAARLRHAHAAANRSHGAADAGEVAGLEVFARATV